MRGSGVFQDVQSGAYYDDAVGEMYSDGIITGYQDGRFGPNDFVTRGQVAVMMQRFKNMMNGTTPVRSSSSSVRRASSSSSSSTTTTSGVNIRGRFEFTTATFSISESAPKASVSVRRVGGTTGDASVFYETVDGTADNVQDYTNTNGRLDFADGDDSIKTINVSIKNDEEADEGSHTFTIRLKDPTNGTQIGDLGSVTVTILDNDGSTTSNSGGTSSATSSTASASPQGSLHFSAINYAVPENENSITITVERSGGTEGSVTVDYETKKDTASLSDFGNVGGTLSFAAGEATKTFNVTVNDNDAIGGNKTVDLHLKNPTGGAVIRKSSAVLTITDDELPGGDTEGKLRFEEDAYDVLEDRILTAIIKRMNGTKGTVTVEYRTEDGTGKAGQDFTGFNKTMTFRPGEAEKEFTTEILEDDKKELTETFRFELSNPTGGATLTSPSSAQVNIFD